MVADLLDVLAELATDRLAFVGLGQGVEDDHLHSRFRVLLKNGLELVHECSGRNGIATLGRLTKANTACPSA